MSRLLRAGPLAVGVALLVLLAWSFGLGGLGEALRRLSPALLAVYLALTAAVYFAYAWRWRLVSRSLGRDVPLARLASARLAGDAIGNLVPSARLAGEPVRAAIVHAGGVEGTIATAGVALDRLVETVCNIACALLYVSVFWLTHTGVDTQSLRALAVVLVGAALALTVPMVMLWRGISPLDPLLRLFDGTRVASWLGALRRTEAHLIRFFREQPAVFARALLLAFATEALTVCQYHFLLAAFDVHVDLSTLLLTLVGTGVAHSMPTPAALGTLEGTQVAVLTLAAGDPSLGFVVGLILRLHETLLTVAGLVALSVHGLSLTRLPVLRAGREASA
jgi:uncharacterized protein (TIRG00374 family)